MLEKKEWAVEAEKDGEDRLEDLSSSKFLANCQKLRLHSSLTALAFKSLSRKEDALMSRLCRRRMERKFAAKD